MKYITKLSYLPIYDERDVNMVNDNLIMILNNIFLLQYYSFENTNLTELLINNTIIL